MDENKTINFLILSSSIILITVIGVLSDTNRDHFDRSNRIIVPTANLRDSVGKIHIFNHLKKKCFKKNCDVGFMMMILRSFHLGKEMHSFVPN